MQDKIPQKLIHNKSAYFPSVKINWWGKISKTNKNPKIIPHKTLKWKLNLGALSFQNIKIGVNPITIVPLMVVADKISASKNTGIVPKNAIKTIDHRPNLSVFPNFKSRANNLANDEKVESNVDAAEVIIIKLMTNRITTPNALPTSTAACPCIPLACA